MDADKKRAADTIADWGTHQAQIGTEAELHTIPLLVVDDRDPSHEPNLIGSGVLVSIAERFFVLTAGHCTTLLSHPRVLTFAGSSTNPRTRPEQYPLKIIARDFRHDHQSEHDFGFIELQGDCGRGLEAHRRVFASFKRLVVCTTPELIELNPFVVVAGYPNDLRMARDRPTHIGLGLFHYSARLRSPTDVPSSPIQRRYPNHHVVDLWVPGRAVRETSNSGLEPARLPESAGVSGGGVWNTLLPASLMSWSPRQMALIGIHISHANLFAPDGERHTFYRSVLVGHHLHLIAESDPTMRDHILKKWPNVADFPI